MQNANAVLTLLHTEARKNYLAQYIQKTKNFALQFNQELEVPEFQKMANDESIKQMEKYIAESLIPSFDTIKSFGTELLVLKNELKIALLAKIGNDAAGIRPNLASHFHQLGLQNRTACVDLTEAGLSFNWDTQHAQQQFFDLLTACGIEVSLTESIPSLDGYANATYSVVVSHRHFEKLLTLCQYHPYNLQEAANDLYQAKGLNRSQCLIQSALKLPTNTLDTIKVGETNRISLNNDYDLVAITLDALAPKSENSTPKHVVILFDDSGSMSDGGGMKITAANAALAQFVEGLPNDTLVSLQPFNANTALVRIAAGKIKQLSASEKKKLFNIPAGGGTPLFEMLACSALFLREPGSLLLTEDALNNTTVVMLTDGQANGQATNAIATMQNSNSMSTKHNINVPGVSAQEKTVSYGINGFSCRQLPVVFSIAIGSDSDQKFIDDLSQQLSSPHAYISDKAADMQEQIKEAFNLLTAINGRIPGAFVGLSYDNPTTGKQEVIAAETRNLFCGRTRNVEFRVPKQATNIQVCVMVNENQGIYKVANTYTAKADAIKAYLEEEFLKLRMDYSSKFHHLQALMRGETPSFGRSRHAIPIPSNASEFLKDIPKKAKAIEELKALSQNTTEEINLLLSLCSNVEQIADMQLFVDAINNPDVINTGVDFTKSDVHNNRGATAKMTQNRCVGDPVPNERLHPIEKTIFNDIDEMDVNPEFVLAKIRENSSLLEEKQQANAFQATPLIYAIALLTNEKQSHKKRALMKLILSLLAEFPISMLAQDSNGQTALHRAVWAGEFELAKILIEKAMTNGELTALKCLRNKILVGATEGETFIENIRTTDNLNFEQKKEILSVLAEPVKSESLFSAIAEGNIAKIMEEIEACSDDLNRHGAEQLGYPTPLFSMLYQLVHAPDAQTKTNFCQAILALLETHKDMIDLGESNSDGNTILHYAIYHGQLDIAEKIIAIANEKGQLTNLLKARNILPNAEGKGETPILNMVKQYHKCQQKFINICEAVNQAIVKGHGEFSALPDELLLQFQSATDYYFQCKAICKTLLPCLTNLQITEVAHLKAVHDKFSQGYSAYYWLKAAPIPAIKKLITDCRDLIRDEGDLILVTNLSDQLNQLLSNQIKPEAILAFIGKELYETKITHPAMRELFKKAAAVMEQHTLFAEFVMTQPSARASTSPRLNVFTEMRATQIRIEIPPIQRLEISIGEQYGFTQHPKITLDPTGLRISCQNQQDREALKNLIQFSSTQYGNACQHTRNQLAIVHPNTIIDLIQSFNQRADMVYYEAIMQHKYLNNGAKITGHGMELLYPEGVAAFIYQAIPHNCKTFIKLTKEGNILVLNSNGEVGFYKAREGNYGISFPKDNFARDICCNLLNLKPQHGLVFWGKESRANATYIQPKYFEANKPANEVDNSEDNEVCSIQ